MKKMNNLDAIELDMVYTRGYIVQSADGGRAKKGIFSAIAATENVVDMGDGVQEVLLCTPENVRVNRMENGTLPVLVQHEHGLDSQVGVLEDFSFETEGGNRLIINFRVSKTEEILRQKIQEKIIRNVSVGYLIHHFFMRDGIRYVDDWSPTELSIVPMPKDSDCFIRERKNNMAKRIEEPKNDEERAVLTGQTLDAEAAVEDDIEGRSEEDEDQEEREEGEEEEEREEDEEEERSKKHKRSKRSVSDDDQIFRRGLGICTRAGISLREAHKILTTARSLTDVYESVLDTKSKVNIRGGVQSDRSSKSYQQAMSEALFCRMSGQEPSSEGAMRFAGDSLYEMAKESLRQKSVNTRGLDRRSVATRAMHSTSDFPSILMDAVNKYLEFKYKPAPQTWEPFTRVRPVSDFKEMHGVGISGIGKLTEVLEGEEYKKVTLKDLGDSYVLKSYGSILVFTRKMLINDDLGVFDSMPEEAMREVHDLKGDLVWGQFTSNPPMYDNKVLFHSDHGNLAGTGAGLSVNTLAAGRLAMRVQRREESKKNKNDGQRIQLVPKYIVIPPELELDAQKLILPIMAVETGEVNPFMNSMQIVVESRLSDDADAWYLFADKSQIKLFEMALLDGKDKPRLEYEQGFEIDGLKMKISYDCAVKVWDWRGFYKNPGK
jgi:hypothetical protein